MNHAQHSPISSNQETIAESHSHKKDTALSRGMRMFSFLDKPAAYIDEFVDRVRHMSDTNYDIGKKMADMGNYTDAILRLKICLWLAPEHQQANYMLACSYIAKGDTAKATGYMRKAVQLNPRDERAVFMLATLESSALAPDQLPTYMPPSVALDYFSSVAIDYETMQHDSGYRGHQFADEALWDALDRRFSYYHVLELGCGTGLCGQLLAEHAEVLIGVDFCKEMLDQTKAKRRPDGNRVYSQDIFQDIRHYVMDAPAEQFDGIVAAHVFNYVGELSSMIEHSARILKPGGVFVFQVERFANESAYGLITGLGRFGHGDSYIRSYLDHFGMQLLSNDLVRVYPDYDLVQYVVRKPEASES